MARDWGSTDRDERGEIACSADYTPHDMGTFERQRDLVWPGLGADRAEDRPLQIVLTGHSHRRGFYVLTRTAYTRGSIRIWTRLFEFPPPPSNRV